MTRSAALEPTERPELTAGQAAEPESPPEYQPPTVITYRGDELLEALGPMQACTFSGAVLVCG
jgi:hypothetical protein